MLDPWLTKIRNMTNAIYFLAQSVPYTLLHQSQFSNNLLQYKYGSGPKLKLKLPKKSLAHLKSNLEYQNELNRVKVMKEN